MRVPVLSMMCSKGFSSQRISPKSPPAYTRGDFLKKRVSNEESDLLSIYKRSKVTQPSVARVPALAGKNRRF